MWLLCTCCAQVTAWEVAAFRVPLAGGWRQLCCREALLRLYPVVFKLYSSCIQARISVLQWAKGSARQLAQVGEVPVVAMAERGRSARSRRPYNPRHFEAFPEPLFCSHATFGGREQPSCRWGGQPHLGACAKPDRRAHRPPRGSSGCGTEWKGPRELLAAPGYRRASPAAGNAGDSRRDACQRSLARALSRGERAGLNCYNHLIARSIDECRRLQRERLPQL